jgi:hypothetical protein
MADDAFDIKKFALTDEKIAELGERRPARKKSRTDDGHDVPPELEQERARKRADQFIMVPMSWSDRLRVVPEDHAGTYKLALAILRRQFERKKDTFSVSNVFAGQERLGPKAKRRALRELASLGLIKVVWCPRKSPVVTVLRPLSVPTSNAKH